MQRFIKAGAAAVLAVLLIVACATQGNADTGARAQATATPAAHELTLNEGEHFMVTCTGGSVVTFGSNGSDQLIGGCVAATK